MFQIDKAYKETIQNDTNAIHDPI